MPWKKMRLRDADVLARCDDRGELVPGADGRVEVRYGPRSPKAYRAGAKNLSATGDATILPDTHCVALDDDPRPDATPSASSAAKRPAVKKLAPKLAGHDPATAADRVIAYADGACTGNPGPCGLGVLVLEGGKRRELSEFLGRGTNNIAELTAILRVAELVKDGDSRTVEIHTDSQYAIGVLSKGWKAKANVELVAEVKKALARLKSVKLHYVPGHAGVPGNERADELARAAVVARASSGWV